MLRFDLALWISLGAVASAAACTGDGGSGRGKQATSGVDGGGSDATPSDFLATEKDFECIKDWTKVRGFYVTNKAGKLDETLAVANAGTGTYPVGTIVQLVPFEAMVKRGAGFSPDSHDWEFFSLSVSAPDGGNATGTQILKRGTKDVVNQFNGNCFGCHSKAEPQYDLICESSHGCDPLPIGADVIKAVQDGDPRCGK